ncbi:MAG TPA: DUF5703 domain-containing protein [Verrucomicrobiae bacterium]|jgi:hypothetical protein|nr:DUF5703 domain-containing protein [Verrucomicrobiae bacterium]
MHRKLAAFLLICAPLLLAAKENHFTAASDVTWNTLGTNENDSMPLGNGDLALNAWTEQNGDIVLLLAKSDAWSENAQLLKLGRVRVKLTPNPFTTAASFQQTLKLESGEIEIRGGDTTARIWADANHPVIHLQVESKQPVAMEATAELWRTNTQHLNHEAVSRAGFFEWGNNPDGLTFDPDTVGAETSNRVTWCHFNTRSIYPLDFEKQHLEALLPKYPDPILHRCFGVVMQGPDLVSAGPRVLKSTAAARSLRLDLCALTQSADSPEAWQKAAIKLADDTTAVSLSKAWKAHEHWWNEFWNRSWIHITGGAEAEEVSQSYALQRYMTACAGRGAQPIKFNGSLFCVGHDLPAGQSSTEKSHDPDYRAWGASFWNQNTRQIYWPLLASGDDDLLDPWFDMYVLALPLAEDRTRAYFHHGGAAIIETIYFWGLPNVNDFGWNNPGLDLQSPWMRYHIQGGLEVVAQMLDRYDYIGDAAFAKNKIVPLASSLVAYYGQHWPRGADGKIHMTPAQSIETYQENAVNPTPDIAALKSVLPRLLALPPAFSTESQRQVWTETLRDLPAIPLGTTAHGKLPPAGKGDPDGKRTILPAEKYGSTKNSENPELYTVFPYRLYGVGKPDLELARDTYHARLFPFAKCWGQDGMESALLGLTDDARNVAVKTFTSYGNERFKWFWSKNSDWIPDMDNGGVGMETLQFMLLQCDGRRILLTPAWPKDWTADFRLRAPAQTIVEGHVENGNITGLKVTPAARAKDVEIMAPAN